jgi:hypothetical protein
MSAPPNCTELRHARRLVVAEGADDHQRVVSLRVRGVQRLMTDSETPLLPKVVSGSANAMKL